MCEHEEVFALLDLPFVPLVHILGLLPHTSLLPLAASCKYLHTIVHSSPFLWRRLLLKPSMLTCTCATQSFILVLKKHGNSVTAVKVKYSEMDGYLKRVLRSNRLSTQGSMSSEPVNGAPESERVSGQVRL